MFEQCGFCFSSEGHICSSCLQKILLLSAERLREAHAMALQRGNIGKAEILESYMEEVFENDGGDAMARRSFGGRRVRRVRHEKEPARPAQARSRFPIRQTHQHEPGLSLL